MRRLIIRPGAIGDCILALPAMESLRAAYREVWVASQTVPLIRFAERVRSIASTGLDMLGIPDREPPPGLLAALRGFDSIVSWYGAGRPELHREVERLGLPFRFLTALPGRSDGPHAADFFLRQVNGRGPAVPRIDCPPPRQREFAVIHPFSGSAGKNWHLERYRELAARLGRRIRVCWCAGPEEALPGAVRIADLYELACWLAGARLFIGNDSGIAHLAAAAGTPVVALFGPTDPKVWAPRGERVRIVATPSPGEPIERIALPQVQEAAEELLAGV